MECICPTETSRTRTIIPSYAALIVRGTIRPNPTMAFLESKKLGPKRLKIVQFWSSINQHTKVSKLLALCTKDKGGN